jgi:hypothetical protein
MPDFLYPGSAASDPLLFANALRPALEIPGRATQIGLALRDQALQEEAQAERMRQQRAAELQAAVSTPDPYAAGPSAGRSSRRGGTAGDRAVAAVMAPSRADIERQRVARNAEIEAERAAVDRHIAARDDRYGVGDGLFVRPSAEMIAMEDDLSLLPAGDQVLVEDGLSLLPAGDQVLVEDMPPVTAPPADPRVVASLESDLPQVSLAPSTPRIRNLRPDPIRDAILRQRARRLHTRTGALLPSPHMTSVEPIGLSAGYAPGSGAPRGSSAVELAASQPRIEDEAAALNAGLPDVALAPSAALVEDEAELADVNPYLARGFAAGTMTDPNRVVAMLASRDARRLFGYEGGRRARRDAADADLKAYINYLAGVDAERSEVLAQRQEFAAQAQAQAQAQRTRNLASVLSRDPVFAGASERELLQYAQAAMSDQDVVKTTQAQGGQDIRSKRMASAKNYATSVRQQEDRRQARERREKRKAIENAAYRELIEQGVDPVSAKAEAEALGQLGELPESPIQVTSAEMDAARDRLVEGGMEQAAAIDYVSRLVETGDMDELNRLLRPRRPGSEPLVPPGSGQSPSMTGEERVQEYIRRNNIVARDGAYYLPDDQTPYSIEQIRALLGV